MEKWKWNTEDVRCRIGGETFGCQNGIVDSGKMGQVSSFWLSCCALSCTYKTAKMKFLYSMFMPSEYRCEHDDGWVVRGHIRGDGHIQIRTAFFELFKCVQLQVPIRWDVYTSVQWFSIKRDDMFQQECLITRLIGNDSLHYGSVHYSKCLTLS